MNFDELDLNDNVLDSLYDMHFDTCTPVQEKCIPEILNGKDVLGVAQTGTGKTAAYLLPILSKLDDGGYPEDAINCVIMSPTRELAQQIDQAMQGFSYYLNGVSSVAVYGGNDASRYDQELKSLRMGADVVIATPGRLITHINMGNVDFSKVSFFVLDEADRMLDMGFSEDIKMIASKLPDNCQTIMFSATMPEKIEELAKTLLKNPVEVKIAVSKPAEKIKQSAYVCYETQKIGIIKDLFRKGDLNRVIIFSGKKQKVKAINRTLQQMKINSGEMHSDLEQAERDEILYKFKTGQIDVLVATDIVARGIDIDDIAMVINFDVPHDPEDYVHRIGRTARAERDGIAITFVADDEIYSFKQIEKFLGREVEKTPLPEGLGETPDYNAVQTKGKNGRGRNSRSNRGRGGDNNKQEGKRGEGNRRRGKKNNDSTDNKAEATEQKDAALNQATQNEGDNQKDAKNNETNSQSPTENKPKKKRKPRRKPANNENGEQRTENGTQKTENGEQRAEKGEKSNDKRNEKKENSKSSNEKPRQQRKPRQNKPRNRNNSKPVEEKKEKISVPAVKQSSAITQILKKPISWLKSLGKKKD